MNLLRSSLLRILLASSLAAATLLILNRRLSGVDVRPDELARLIDRADRLVVSPSLLQSGVAVIFDSSARADLDALKSALRVRAPDHPRHCCCSGAPAIFLYSNGKRIGQITSHHALLIRCNLWKSDAELLSTEAFLRWFDDRRMPRPRLEYQAMLRAEQERARAERKWIEAMPAAALKPLWEKAKVSGDGGPAMLDQALARAVPQKDARILALFAWYGSGAGPWSGYPGYETIAEHVLLRYPTVELLHAAELRS